MNHLQPILLAEDNNNDVELAMAAFDECSLQNRIDLVRDGQQVLDYLRYEGEFENRKKETPLLVLLDINMPKLTGIEALRIIKSDHELKTIPIVMLTSSSMDQEVREAYELGVNAYVVKPVNFDEFIKALKALGLFWAVFNTTPKIK